MRGFLAITIGLLTSVALGDEPALDRAVTDAIELPRVDMAVTPKTLENGVAIRMAPGAPWQLVDLRTGDTTVIATIDDLRRLVKERADKLPGEELASRLDLFLVADARLEWAAMQQALMAAAMAKVARTWIVGRRADGTVGALPAFLPVDVGAGPREKVKAHRVKVSMTVSAAEEDGLVRAGALYAWAWRTKQDAENRPVALTLRAASNGSVGGVAAVVNEARRFGYALSFDGATPRSPDETGEFRAADPAADRFELLPPPAFDAAPPKLDPGVALAGDPHEAPHVPVKEAEAVEDD